MESFSLSNNLCIFISIQPKHTERVVLVDIPRDEVFLHMLASNQFLQFLVQCINVFHILLCQQIVVTVHCQKANNRKFTLFIEKDIRLEIHLYKYLVVESSLMKLESISQCLESYPGIDQARCR